MASSLEDDLSCPVCFEIFQDPQLFSCGHTFCRKCVGYDPAFSAFCIQACPVCQQVIRQKPVPNLALRNTCKSFQKEKEREPGEEDGGIHCVLHGEKVLFFCRDDGQAICSRCKKQNHLLHKVQPLRHAVRQRKDQIKVALRPAEKVLESLRNGTAPEHKITKYIESQAEQTEKQIKAEFEKLHQFLRDEEEVRRAALKEEEELKKGRLERWIEQELQILSDRVMEVETETENDTVTFLSNYAHIMTRARATPPDSQLNSGSLIDVAKHVGNLRFRVWEKMKDLCPYYPVVLDPNSSHMSSSGDLVCVSHSVRRFYSRNPLQSNNHLVLCSEAQHARLNCWDVEVGDSERWTLGVCQHSAAERNHTQPLIPQYGFWGLRRNGNFYNVLGSPQFGLRHPPKTVRVKLVQFDVTNWKLSFLDARNKSEIASITDVPFGSLLFPFLIPEEKNAPLRIVPVNVNVTTEERFSFSERHVDVIVLYILGFCVFLVLFLLLVITFPKTN